MGVAPSVEIGSRRGRGPVHGRGHMAPSADIGCFQFLYFMSWDGGDGQFAADKIRKSCFIT